MVRSFNVFLDTNIFRNLNFQLSSHVKFKILKNLVEHHHITLYINDVVLKECERQIKDNIVVPAHSKFEALNKNLNHELFTNSNLRLELQNNNAENEQELINHAIGLFHKELNNLDVKTINMSNVNATNILNRYFNSELPFENANNKKYEFPDAFLLENIKEFLLADSDREIHVVTEDKGLHDAFITVENCTPYKSLANLLDFISSTVHEASYTIASVHIQENMQEIKNVILDRINNYDSSDIDVSYSCSTDYDEFYIESICLKDIDDEDIMISGIIDELVVAEILCLFDLRLDAYMFDEDRSIWDPEDKRFLYESSFNVIEDHSIQTSITVELEVKVDDKRKETYSINDIKIRLKIDENTLEERHRILDNPYI